MCLLRKLLVQSCLVIFEVMSRPSPVTGVALSKRIHHYFSSCYGTRTGTEDSSRSRNHRRSSTEEPYTAGDPYSYSSRYSPSDGDSYVVEMHVIPYTKAPASGSNASDTTDLTAPENFTLAEVQSLDNCSDDPYGDNYRSKLIPTARALNRLVRTAALTHSRRHISVTSRK